MSAVDPTVDDAVPATSQPVPIGTSVTWAALELRTVSSVPTLQKFLDQRFDMVVRA